MFWVLLHDIYGSMVCLFVCLFGSGKGCGRWFRWSSLKPTKNSWIEDSPNCQQPGHAECTWNFESCTLVKSLCMNSCVYLSRFVPWSDVWLKESSIKSIWKSKETLPRLCAHVAAFLLEAQFSTAYGATTEHIEYRTAEKLKFLVVSRVRVSLKS